MRLLEANVTLATEKVRNMGGIKREMKDVATDHRIRRYVTPLLIVPGDCGTQWPPARCPAKPKKTWLLPQIPG